MSEMVSAPADSLHIELRALIASSQRLNEALVGARERLAQRVLLLGGCGDE